MRLKVHLESTYPNDRVAYTQGKTRFIIEVTERAKLFYRKAHAH